MNRFIFLLLTLLSFISCASFKRYQTGDVEVVTFTIASTNAHLVVQGNNMFLVDSGYEGNARELEEEIRKAGFNPSSIRAIIITHGHADHAGGAQYFKKGFGIKIIGGKGDNGMFESGKNDPHFCPTSLIARFRKSKDQSAVYSSTTMDHLAEAPVDLQPITGIKGTLYPLPGHTAGSLVVVVGEAVFVGDLLRGSIVGSGAETHLYMCDVEANRNDIAKLLNDLAPKAQTIFVGHFGPVTPQDVRKHFKLK